MDEKLFSFSFCNFPLYNCLQAVLFGMSGSQVELLAANQVLIPFYLLQFRHLYLVSLDIFFMTLLVKFHELRVSSTSHWQQVLCLCTASLSCGEGLNALALVPAPHHTFVATLGCIDASANMEDSCDDQLLKRSNYSLVLVVYVDAFMFT